MSVTPFSIPLTDVRITEDDVEAVLAALADGWPAAGAAVERLERAFSAWTGALFCVAVANGSTALELALRAAGVGPGDEVLVPGLTFVASAAAVRHAGATPVLCDVVAPGAPLLDPEDAARRVTPRTRAIVAVHLYGYAADVAALRELCDAHGLALIEDCAQAVGARLPCGAHVGTAGEAGCFSLFSKKQLCVGEGGIVVSRDGRIAERVRALRDPAGAPDASGVPLGLPEPHAAMALSRLARLDADLERRRAAVRRYRERLAGVPGLEPAFADDAVADASHFAFVVLVRDRGSRDALRMDLAHRGVQTTWYPALTTFSAYADHPSLPRAEASADRHLALPLASTTTPEQVDAVVDAVRAAVGA
jgi:dTDP-4-amino-4,6-dideoxygalactose transaminase